MSRDEYDHLRESADAAVHRVVLCKAFLSWLGLRCTREQGHADDHQCGSFSWPHIWPPR